MQVKFLKVKFKLYISFLTLVMLLDSKKLVTLSDFSEAKNVFRTLSFSSFKVKINKNKRAYELNEASKL